YFDTSFVTPLFRPEPTSNALGKFFREFAGAGLATSHWTRAEFSSLVARDFRMKLIDEVRAAILDNAFEAALAQSFTLFAPAVDDIELCKRYLQRYETGLRAGDALHLAIARNNNAQAIYSLDDKMLRAGKLLGLPVRRGIRGR
ncbi:MAG: type II toxin-antitoxin system VapC family toxin, partial [Sinobacteraceae bacterium]|nr:type II toxin-antitoxin system VapC family toxin [Nevskiaceae bacterium]